jgi:hypothetical protein
MQDIKALLKNAYLGIVGDDTREYILNDQNQKILKTQFNTTNYVKEIKDGTNK